MEFRQLRSCLVVARQLHIWRSAQWLPLRGSPPAPQPLTAPSATQPSAQAIGQLKSSLKRHVVDALVDAYVDWREECTSADDAYCCWTRASSRDAGLAFDTYQAAVDREEDAAETYAALIALVGQMPETGLSSPISGAHYPEFEQ